MTEILGLIFFGVGLALYFIGYTDEMFNDPPEDEVPGAPGVPRIPPKETRYKSHD